MEAGWGVGGGTPSCSQHHLPPVSATKLSANFQSQTLNFQGGLGGAGEAVLDWEAQVEFCNCRGKNILGFQWSKFRGRLVWKEKEICHSSHRNLLDRNLMFKINPMQEGLFSSLNPGAALQMLTVTKLQVKNIHGKKVHWGVRPRHLFDVTLGIREHSFQSYKWEMMSSLSKIPPNSFGREKKDLPGGFSQTEREGRKS